MTVPRNRKVDRVTQARVQVAYADLAPADVVLDVAVDAATGVTSPLRTVVDCARRLPFAEALAVADSALRSGTVSQVYLLEVARVVRGRRAAQVRRVAQAADGRAANRSESALRALVLDVGGVDVEPQAAC